MAVEAPFRPGIRAAVVSDTQFANVEGLWRFKGTLKQIRHMDPSLLILPGDIVSKDSSKELIRAFTHVLRESTHQDREGGKHKIPQVIFVEGNNELQLPDATRALLYDRLERDGVTVFRNGVNNVAFIKNRLGMDVATVIGMPYVIPEKEHRHTLTLSPAELVEQHRTLAERIHTKTFEEDLRTAKKKGLPTYIVFHAPPYIEDYELDMDGVDVRRSMIVDLMHRPDAPDIVGIFYGHTNTQGVFSVRNDGIAHIGVCEEVVNREGDRFVPVTLPARLFSPILAVRRRFASQFARREKPVTSAV